VFALSSNTTASYNAAVGSSALAGNTTGTDNTAMGTAALAHNTTGSDNTATGRDALNSNTLGSFNLASGYQALFTNTVGGFNTASGYQALFSNTAGSSNTASGHLALHDNTTGSSNTATGDFSLKSNTTGLDNVADGALALFTNTIGVANTAIGVNALYNATGSNNIALGISAGIDLTTGSYNIAIGHHGLAGESNTIWVGTQGTQTSTYVAGIWQAPLTGTAAAVRVNSSGKLGTVPSSARFKEAIKPMDKASEAILSLQPVSFRYKKELDPNAVPQFGLIAEEVARVAPHLVIADDQGRPFTVRYEEVNAMLLNEFLKEHKKNEQQASEIADLRSTLQDVMARLEARGL